MRPGDETQSETAGREETTEALARDGATTLPGAPRTTAFVSTLVASARHELRSPLQSIQGFAELLESEAYGALTSEQHAFVGHILQGSTELGGVVEACLELAEAELLGQPLALARSSLAGALEQSLLELEVSGAARVERRFARDAEEPRVKLDGEAFRRAVRALVAGLGTTSQGPLTVQLESEGDHAFIRLAQPTVPRGQALTVEEIARQRGPCRSLVWLRLASVLLAKQGALLRVGEHLDRAEVRFRLSPPH